MMQRQNPLKTGTLLRKCIKIIFCYPASDPAAFIFIACSDKTADNWVISGLLQIS